MRISSLVSTVVTVGGTLLGLWFGANSASNPVEPTSPTPVAPASVSTPTPKATVVPRPANPPAGGVMLQKDFPCHEDEVLAYHPRFGPDYVGCIHIDEVRNTTW